MEDEEDAYYEARINGELTECNRYNTTAYTFLGELAVHDHVFIEKGQIDESTLEGAYVFKDNELFKKLAAFILEHHFPMILNQTEVPELDLMVWEEYFLSDLRDSESFPQEWE